MGQILYAYNSYNKTIPNPCSDEFSFMKIKVYVQTKKKKKKKNGLNLVYEVPLYY